MSLHLVRTVPDPRMCLKISAQEQSYETEISPETCLRAHPKCSLGSCVTADRRTKQQTNQEKTLNHHILRTERNKPACCQMYICFEIQKNHPKTIRPRTSSYGIYPNLEYLLSVCLITGKGLLLFCWVSCVSILIFLWYSWNFTRKKTVSWPILGNVLFIWNAFMSTQRQTITVINRGSSSWWLACLILCSSLAHLSLPFLCSAPSEFQCRLNPFFHVPITCWALLLLLFHSWERWVEALSPICCWSHVWWSLWALPSSEYSEIFWTLSQTWNWRAHL